MYVYLCMYLSIYVSIYLSMYLSMYDVCTICENMAQRVRGRERKDDDAEKEIGIGVVLGKDVCFLNIIKWAEHKRGVIGYAKREGYGVEWPVGVWDAQFKFLFFFPCSG